MRIVGIEAWRVEMGLDEPYEIASQRFDSATNVFLRIDTDRGVSGFGCGAPEPAVTGETPESVLAAIDDVLRPLVTGLDPLRRVAVLERARRELAGQPTAIATLDLALHDLLGRVADLPVYRLLGGFRTRIRTSITIGILPVDETVERARERWTEGFRALKLKGGRDPELDAERIIRVREALGKGVEIRFDGNRGYTLEQARRFLTASRPARLSIVEQPTAEPSRELLGEADDERRVAIMADESLVSLRDAFRLARGRLVDMLNIKLMKVGGIDQALRMTGVASAARLTAMVGCMDESALGIAGALHFALARPAVTCADLDGHVGLRGDPAAGCVVLRDGWLEPREVAGLGVELS